MNVRTDIINFKEIKNKIVSSHVYNIHFQDLFLLFFEIVYEFKNQIIYFI